MEKMMSDIGSIAVVQKPFAKQINAMFWCNGNTGLKWQRGCIFKVISIFRYFLLFLAQKETWNYNLVDDCIVIFKQEWCKIIVNWHRWKRYLYNELIWHFIDS